MKKMCKKCLLHTKIPNVNLNEDGLCEACLKSNALRNDYSRRFAKTKFINLIKKLSQEGGKYNVAVMLSGGKDSAFLLELAINTYHLRPLAISVIHPLMNETAIDNVDSICDNMNVDLVKIEVNEHEYKKIMKYGIMNSLTYQLDEFFGCYLCSNIFKWLVIKKAMEYKIPLVLDGSDRSQTEKPYYIDSNKIKHDSMLREKPLGVFHDIICQALGNGYSKSPYFLNLEEVKEYYPTIVAPFTFMEVQRKRVEEKSLNKIFTNCDAVPFFSVFTLKNYDCVPYIRHYSNELRNGYGNLIQLKIDYDFNEKLSRNTYVKLLEEYSVVIKYIIQKVIENEELLSEARVEISNYAPTYKSIFGEEVCMCLLDSIMKIPEYFKFFEIDIKEVIK